MAAASKEGSVMDARTRKLAGLAIIAVGIVLAVVGGLADQVGIGANDEGEMGGKQIAALVVGLLLVVAGAVLATVLAKDKGGADTPSADTAEAEADATATPAAGTPVVDDTDAADTDAADETVEADGDTAESDEAEEGERVEVTDSSD
jgi:hypothetical protein